MAARFLASEEARVRVAVGQLVRFRFAGTLQVFRACAGNNVDMDVSFGHWLAGFIDGEGCFQIIRNTPTSAAHRCEFTIQLRADDAATLNAIRAGLGFGRVHGRTARAPSSPSVCFKVSAREDCAKLVEVLDAYPLRAKKRADYALWREAVLIWDTRRRGRGGGPRPGDDAIWERMGQLASALRELRAFNPTLALAREA